MKERTQNDFRSGIPPADPGHVPAAAFLAQAVSHRQSKQSGDYSGQLSRKCWRDGVTDLLVLSSAGTTEEIVVREGLQSGGFPYRQASAL